MQQSYKLLAISHWLLNTRITEETLPHFPIPSFGGANAFNDAGGFEVGKMLLDGFGRDAYLCCKSSSTQRTIICQRRTIFSLLFTVFSLPFSANTTFSPYFSVIGSEDAKRMIS